MPQKISDLGSWAEKHFDLLCAEAGVVCNKSNEDKTGWDFLVEFPPDKNSRKPPDLLPIEKSARIQVKSKESGPAEVRLKLSNAERFAKSEQPCFVVLALSSEGRYPVRIFAKHFWENEISATLKRLRRAESSERPLHKSTININFSDSDDHTSDLISWMKCTLDSIEPYHIKKRKYVETVGYDDQSMIGTITFRTENLQDLVDHTIGLKENFEPERVKLIDKRFGIEAKIPVFDLKSVRIQMQTPPEPCFLVARSKDRRTARFEGKLFRTGIPGLPLGAIKMRVSASPIEMVMSGTGAVDFRINFDGTKNLPLDQVKRFARFSDMAQKGQVDFTLSADKIPNMKMSGNIDFSDDRGFMASIEDGISALENLCHYVEENSVSCKLDDLCDDWQNFMDFAGFVNGNDMSFSARMTDEALRLPYSPCRRVLLYGYQQVSDWAFLSIVERPTKSDTLEDGVRKMIFGQPRVLDAIVRLGLTSDHLHELRDRYVEIREQNMKGTAVLNDGDFTALMKDWRT